MNPNPPQDNLPADLYKRINTEPYQSFAGFLDEPDARSAQRLFSRLREDIRVPRLVSIAADDDLWDDLRFYLSRYLRAAGRSGVDASGSAYAHLISATMIRREHSLCTNGLDLHIALQTITLAGSMIGGRCAAHSLAAIAAAARVCLTREGVIGENTELSTCGPWTVPAPADPDGNAAIFCAVRPFYAPLLLATCARASFENRQGDPLELPQLDGAEESDFLLSWASFAERTAAAAAELARLTGREKEHDRP
ncbi:MAG: hypothetical protein JJU33_05250 [Phycisphaerales bacterium]|nr:hypothetical protein [Phycisphaerales bacterium]